MEPLNSYPDVHLPKEAIDHWHALRKPVVFEALTMFARTQLVYGRCGPTDENLRAYCQVEPEVFLEIVPWLKEELEADSEGKRGFRFIETAQLKGKIKSMEGTLAALVARNPMMGSEALPEKVQAVLATLPAGSRLEVRGKLMKMMRALQAAAVVRLADAKERETASVAKLVEEELARRTLARGPELASEISTGGPSGKPQGTLRLPTKPGVQVVDDMKAGGGYPDQQKNKHPPAPAGATATGSTQMTPKRPAPPDPPSDSRRPSHRRGSTMFPVGKNPRGGPRGGKAPTGAAKVVEITKPQSSKRTRVEMRSRTVRKAASGRRAARRR